MILINGFMIVCKFIVSFVVSFYVLLIPCLIGYAIGSGDKDGAKPYMIYAWLEFIAIGCLIFYCLIC